MPLTFNAIFLGNSPISLDPTEGNQIAENANQFATQTFGGPGNALAGEWVSFTSVNNGGVATALDMDNNVVTDQAIINNGSGPVTYTFDGTAVFTGTITYIDGTVANPTPPLQFVLVQMSNGDLYLVPRPTAADPTNAALVANQIQSVTFTGLVGDTYSGMGADRPVISFITCFTPGTAIAVPGGHVPVEDLRPGDLVQTKDHGPQELLWVGRRTLGPAELRLNPNLCPIRISAGALGQGVPQRDLLVSPQHRVLVSSRIAQRMFDAPEVLVGAKHLAGLPGIAVDSRCQTVSYLHIACARHEVIFAEGAATESLYLGAQSLAALTDDARRELLTLFPELTSPEGVLPVARPLVPGRKGRALRRRHEVKALPLVA